MKTKITKESRNLLIGLLLGDGTISNNNVFKIAHSEKQKEYLEWKIKQLKECGIRNNGLKSYIKTCGYKTGEIVYYTQLNIIPFIKVLRRVFYKTKKIIGNRKLLNRLSAREIAIWYMDDGHINIRKSKEGKYIGFYIKISTCEPKNEVQVIIDYFKEVWNINFYLFHEGKKEDSYSLCCGTKEGKKFIKIIEPYVTQIPSMKYKINYNLTQDINFEGTLKCGNAQHYNNSEDIVSSLQKYKVKNNG